MAELTQMERFRMASDDIDRKYDAMLVDGIPWSRVVAIERKRDEEHAALQATLLQAVRNA